MDFAIRKDARVWFKAIRSDLKALPGTVSAEEFDAFYFCFIAGIAAGRKRDAASAETDSLVDNFPGPYENRGRLLISLFLDRELKEMAITMSQKTRVHAEVARLVDPTAKNSLSPDGVREFNKYSHGGFEVLLEWFDHPPQSLEAFLRIFSRRVGEVLAPTA